MKNNIKLTDNQIELQKEVDDAFKKAIERITNIISEI